jgi:hypothetical protein
VEALPDFLLAADELVDLLISISYLAQLGIVHSMFTQCEKHTSSWTCPLTKERTVVGRHLE